MFTFISVVAIFSGAFLLLAKQASILIWTISFAILTALVSLYGSGHFAMQLATWIVFLILALSSIKPLRRLVLSRPIFTIASKAMPDMSLTEREALEAGTVSWEGDLFSGSPDFSILLDFPAVTLTAEEQAFLDGPVNTLCRMLNDWDITQNRVDLPPEVWTFIKENKFLGMIIPKQYGGLEFSATAQMSVLVKLYSCSITAATTVSVPNSLGPAELLLKYGTEEQKNHYLPRLAIGEDIPCFALTGPNAGSDAASIPDSGFVCRRTVNGEEILGMSITWDKRYITLSPVATVIGLAFRLFDPENLLGKGEDIGICCALIPAETVGVIKGRRHFPLNVAFMNGPTQGNNVFVPIDCLIGGAEMAGHGWRMLMECLSVGRAISLPSSASGASQAAALATGAYARIRKQFHQPIAKFEGIEEPLARIAGNTYIIDAVLTMTVAAIDNGAKPPVAGAIVKYHTTERSRHLACDAMDIHGGKGICLGPNNYLARGFQSCPISITVEGANILSRNLIIFGQGAIRCHPYVFPEMESIRNNNLRDFDTIFWGHFEFTLSNLVKTLAFGLTGARWVSAPKGPMSRYFQLIALYSTNLAFISDLSMFILGGQLKRKETISARLGDILSSLYLISAVLKRYHNDGEPKEDWPLIRWCSEQLFHECETALHGVILNFPVRWMRGVLRCILLPYGLRRKKPSDQLGRDVAHILTTPSETRTRLSRLAFYEDIANSPIGRVEAAFQKICAAEALEKKVMHAAKEGKLKALTLLKQIEEAKVLNLLSPQEIEQLYEAELARQYVIAVDDFSSEELQR
ncbi:MAG: acyl-CoA dehydrogenase [Legionellaceae bacterium]|nr:acyl-CoA dehydrogenase [Legionellaceae bacterium]